MGRRSGKPREAILGYIEDGPNLVTMAMNGWADPEPAWWLNLQARPDVTVVLAGGDTREVHARAAEGAERQRLFERWAQSESNDLGAYMRRRSRETAIVVLEPRDCGTPKGRTCVRPFDAGVPWVDASAAGELLACR